MPKQYCPSCGAGTEYSLSAPKFCAQCGSGFGVPAVSRASVPSTPVRRKRPQVVVDDDEDFYDDEDEQTESDFRRKFPKKLDITVDPIPKLHKESLANIAPPTGLESLRETENLNSREKQERLNRFRQRLQTTQRHDAHGAEE